MTTRRHFEVEQRGEVAIAKIVTRKILDEATVQAFGSELVGLVRDFPQIVVDCTTADYFSSSVLQKLINADGERNRNRGRWRFCAMNMAIREFFEDTRMDRIIPIQRTCENALTAIASRPCVSVVPSGDVAVVMIEVADLREEFLIDDFAHALFGLVEDADSKVLVNFTGVTNVGPGAVGKLIEMQGRMGRHGAAFKLCCMKPEILEVFTVPRLHETTLTILQDGSLEDAIATFK